MFPRNDQKADVTWTRAREGQQVYHSYSFRSGQIHKKLQVSTVKNKEGVPRSYFCTTLYT